MQALPFKRGSTSLLTTHRLLAVFFVQLNESYQITVLLPMVVFMVRDFGIQSELLGIYTSILNASFCFCQFLCCYWWGLLSDKYGRRSALISGLIFSTIAITSFGFSKNFMSAIISRSIGGFFNGNLGVIKAYLSDITDGSNRAWAFSILAIAYGFGSVMGSLCGGIFIETHDLDADHDEYVPTVGIIKWWIFENEYPFLIPCLIGAIISWIALILTLSFIHNENLRMDILSDLYRENSYQSVQSVISEEYMIATLDAEEHGNPPYSLNELAKMAIFETCPGDGIHSIDIQAYSLRSNTHSFKSNDLQALILSNLKKDINKEMSSNLYTTVKSLMFETKLSYALVVWTLNIMAIMMYQEMNPVYMAQALEFNSQLIGYAMGFSGFCLLLFTYFVQPYFLERFRFRPMCIICCIAMCFIILHMPSIFTTVREMQLRTKSTRKIVSLILACANSMAVPCFTSISIVCAMCFVNNSVPNSCVGRANGLAQSGACFVRAVGPALTGFIWSGAVAHIFTNKIAVYYAYLPSFICYVLIALWIYLYIGYDAQLMWEERIANDRSKNTRPVANDQQTTSN